jgi:hypothetical protein
MRAPCPLSRPGPVPHVAPPDKPETRSLTSHGKRVVVPAMHAARAYAEARRLGPARRMRLTTLKSWHVQRGRRKVGSLGLDWDLDWDWDLSARNVGDTAAWAWASEGGGGASHGEHSASASQRVQAAYSRSRSRSRPTTSTTTARCRTQVKTYNKYSIAQCATGTVITLREDPQAKRLPGKLLDSNAPNVVM